MRTLSSRGAAAIVAAAAVLPALAVTTPALAAPDPTPAAITIAAPACGAAAGGSARYSIRVDGVHFNPFNQVLVTFDAGSGGRPESFATSTDGFGRFGLVIEPTGRPAGSHVVRADDFRQREAAATFAVPCPSGAVPGPVEQRFTPQLRFDPALARPGRVVQIVGTGFPPGQTVVLAWVRRAGEPAGIVVVQAPGMAPDRVTADQGGGFRAPVVILHHDAHGPRTLGAAPGGPVLYAAAPTADLLVVPGTLQPGGFTVRR